MLLPLFLPLGIDEYRCNSNHAVAAYPSGATLSNNQDADEYSNTLADPDNAEKPQLKRYKETEFPSQINDTTVQTQSEKQA